MILPNGLLALLAALTASPSTSVDPLKPPEWIVLARCAAAYRANVQIDRDQRAPTMLAIISEQAVEYEAAALRHLNARPRPADRRVVRVYVLEQERRFNAQPRREIERVIEACPQPED